MFGLGISRSQGDVYKASDLLNLRFTPMSIYKSTGRGSGFPLVNGSVGLEIGWFRSANNVYGQSSQINFSMLNVELSLFVVQGNQFLGASITINKWSTRWPSLSFWLVDTR